MGHKEDRTRTLQTLTKGVRLLVLLLIPVKDAKSAHICEALAATVFPIWNGI